MSKYDPLKINRSKLNDELSNQAATFAYAAEETEILHAELDKLELELDIKTDAAAQKIRDKYRAVVAKLRPNETSIKAMVGAMPEVKELREQYNEVNHAYRISKIKVEALKMRAEMMVSMAHNIRQERKASQNPKV